MKTITVRTIRSIQEYIAKLDSVKACETEVITDLFVDKGYDYSKIRSIVRQIQNEMGLR